MSQEAQLHEHIRFSCHRKRGTFKGSVTCICNRLKDLTKQATETSPSEVVSHAKLLLNQLETLNDDFKKCHSALIDLIEDERILNQEQKVLDKHDDKVAALTLALQQLVAAYSPSGESGLRKTVCHRLTCVCTVVSTITGSLATASDNICPLQLNEYEIKGHRIELSEI